VPVGVIVVLGLVSVTVNVHVVGTLGVVEGQMIPRTVDRFVTVKEVMPELDRCKPSPE